MIPQFVLFAIEKIMNFYLALDPATPTRLARLADEVILLQASDYDVNLYFLPKGTRLRLVRHAVEAPTVIIKGKLFDILKSTLKDIGVEQKANRQLNIEGNMEVAQEFRDLLKNVTIDWEEHLSHYLGDTAAHQIHYQSKKVFNWGHNVAAQTMHNLSEYLQYESSLLPSRQEVEDFFNDVYGLQEDVARLAAKMDLLFAKLENE